MDNEFSKVMSNKTDDELIKIVTVNRNKYQELAIVAANQEIENRKIDVSRVEEISAKFEREKELTKKIENNSVRSRIRLVNFVIDFVVILILFSFIAPVFEQFLPLLNRIQLSIYRIGSLLFFIAVYYIPLEYKTQKNTWENYNEN